MLFVQSSEGNLLQVDAWSQILRNKNVCETIGPVGKKLSKVHKADVHVFSDSVPCLGKQAMNMPEIKFTERLKKHLSYFKEIAKRISGEQNQLWFHIFLGKATKEIMLKINE